MLTASIFMSAILSAVAIDDTCKYEFNVPTKGGCVVHTKEMELSYQQMKSDIASGHERTNQLAESFTKEIGILHEKSEDHKQKLEKMIKEIEDMEGTLKALPQITQELAEVSKSLSENKRRTLKIHQDHKMFSDYIDQLKKEMSKQASNISSLATEMSEHRIALMSYGVAMDKMKSPNEKPGSLRQQMKMLKNEVARTRDLVTDLSEKVLALQTSVESIKVALASLGRLPSLVKRLQEQINMNRFRRR